jgi:hypothetical protein
LLHACTNGIPLGCSLLLPVGTVHCIHTLQAVGPLVLPTVGLETKVYTFRAGWSTCYFAGVYVAPIRSRVYGGGGGTVQGLIVRRSSVLWKG